MITHEDQIGLFNIIGERLTKEVICYAFGGTAMMFFGYKDQTKDVDILFETKKEREDFIEVIEKLGFVKHDPIKIYIKKKALDKSKPVMYIRNNFRFDLFAGTIFRTNLSPNMKEHIYGTHEFGNLSMRVINTEQIVYLKAITDRKNDFDDIQLILNKEIGFNWQYLIDEAIWQHKNGDSWALLDVEKMIKALKKYVFVEEKYLKQIYNAQD